MKVLGIVGSPRKNGNTDILVGTVLESAESAGATVEKIYLNDLNFRECQGCGVCKSEGKCSLDDDMQQVYTKMLDADCIVVGSPVYFQGVSAQTKKFIDRCYALFDHKFETQLKGKKGVTVVVCGIPDITMTSSTTQHLLNVMKFAGMDAVDSIEASALNPGDVLSNNSVIEKAKTVGKGLV
jgi:multimeric flavodoxin WrbA